MSSQHYRPAYATRLGNLTAKSILVLLCDQANDDGMGWPSIASIVKGTEINRRTVQRVVEVFAAIGLIERRKAEVSDRFGRRTVDAIFVNLGMLGTDLTEQFAMEYARSQGKVAERKTAGRWRLRDALPGVSETEPGVSETYPDVSETKPGVSETYPPDPLLGGPVIDPELDPSPDPNARVAVQGDEPPLDREQQEHLARVAERGEDPAPWRRHYVDENRKAEETAALLRAEEIALEREYPDIETGLAKMRKQCGFAWAEGDELGPVLRQVVLDQLEMGKPVWRTIAQMRAMWKLQVQQGARLRARYGPLKFFRDGHWLDSDGWHWNPDAMKGAG